MDDASDHPMLRLSLEDLNMVTTFVLQSGSVKALADSYGVSYPTMRGRLDALIERLRKHVEGRPVDPLAEHLAELIAKGRIGATDARRIRDLHRQAVRAAEAGSERTTSTPAEAINR